MLSFTSKDKIIRLIYWWYANILLVNFLIIIIKCSPIGPIFTLAHVFKIVHIDTFLVELSKRSSFFDIPSWIRGPCVDVCEDRSWSLYVPQSPVSWVVTRTCTHLWERGYLLFCFRDYLLSCVFAAIWQILVRGGSDRLQSNQPKIR